VKNPTSDKLHFSDIFCLGCFTISLTKNLMQMNKKEI